MAHRQLITAGWATLLVAVATPFSVAATYFMTARASACGIALPYFATAPLIATCGEPGQAELTLGWSLTVLTVACILLSTVAAILAVVEGKDHVERTRGALLAASIVVTLAATLLVALQDPFASTSWPAGGSYLMIGTFVGFIALSVCRVIAAVLVALVGKTHQPHLESEDAASGRNVG